MEIVTEEEKTNVAPEGNENKTNADQQMFELDGVVENASSTKPVVETHKYEKKLSPREIKAKREAEHKARLKAEKEQLKKMQKEQKSTGKSGKNKKVIVTLIIFALLIGGFTVMYFKNPQFLRKSQHAQSIANEEIVVDTVFQDTVVEQEEQPETVEQPVSTKKTNSSKISTPCWIISYASITKESKAAVEVKKLVEKGYISGYYWIPDYDATGKQLYKIYVGPFATKNEGQEKLKEIQLLSNDAYLMKLK